MQTTATAHFDLYNEYVNQHPDWKLLRKPAYKRGFLAGASDRLHGNNYHIDVDSHISRSLGYSDGWQMAGPGASTP